jgi:hypothetical protein
LPLLGLEFTEDDCPGKFLGPLDGVTATGPELYPGLTCCPTGEDDGPWPLDMKIELLSERLGAMELLDAGAAAPSPELYPGLLCGPTGENDGPWPWDMEL